ncbi:hypothetical protein Syun_018120 [Stephania yunnanensis]|uniref:Glycerol-3-phosphate acyltransferase, chloroplastic n=1 Tax=Stephania yunnanensis TaxID=152371 RepID=A0AAP0NVI4_9MAGN
MSMSMPSAACSSSTGVGVGWGSASGGRVSRRAASDVRVIQAVGSRVRRCCRCAVEARVRSMAELVEEKESTMKARRKGKAERERGFSGRPRTFLHARSGEDLLLGVRQEHEAGRVPPNVAAGLEKLYRSYRNAVIQSGNTRADEIILSNMSVVFDRIILDIEDPFTFSPHHKGIREPFDYYRFGQNYIQPLIDFRRSFVGNVSLFHEMEDKLREGHNVILISNHQSEADPAVIASLLESTNPYIAENITYVAGDRVITDPLSKPFSMGRNLICVYSKKHLNDIPEEAEMKRRSNTRSLKEMAMLLRGGSQIIWIAPSGGRDRPDHLTGEWFPENFDASAVDNMRRLSDHSGVPGHVYPLALLCYDIMPPPAKVEKEIGEQRVMSFHGVGLSVASEIKISDVAAGIANPDEAKEAFSLALYHSVIQQYHVLKAAIHGNQGLNASNSMVSLSQPRQ